MTTLIPAIPLPSTATLPEPATTLAAARHYDARGTDALPSDGRDPVVNMGLWRRADGSRPATLHEANFVLFDRVLGALDVGPGDTIVDAGCGFGTAALRAAETLGAHVLGVNVSSVQLEDARRRAWRAGEGRVRFVQQSATALRLPDACIDGLYSVEAAFHFDTRAQFFREAFRVLRPGARLSLADLVLVPATSAIGRATLRSLSQHLAFPEANVYGLETYCAELRAAGFEVQVCESIREDVVPHFRRWMLRNALAHRAFALDLGLAPYLVYPWDYAVLVARKPVKS